MFRVLRIFSLKIQLMFIEKAFKLSWKNLLFGHKVNCQSRFFMQSLSPICIAIEVAESYSGYNF